jgi:GNAT superfamily N-acetyltransferase
MQPSPGDEEPVRIVEGTDQPARGEVYELYLRAFSAPPLCEGPREADLFAALYERLINEGGAVVATCRSCGGELIGLCYGAPWRWGEHTDAWAEQLRERLTAHSVDFLEAALAVYLLAVDPGHQGRGLGSRLLEAVLEAADADRAWLVTTDVDSPAMRLYRGLGWRQLGHGPDAPDGRPSAVLGLARARSEAARGSARTQQGSAPGAATWTFSRLRGGSVRGG